MSIMRFPAASHSHFLSCVPRVALILAFHGGLLGLPSARAFTPGNLVIYRAGTGSGALSGISTAVFLDEYSTSGTLVQTVALPTAISGANQPLTCAGSATSEGMLTRSADGRYLLLTGYAAVPGTLAITSTASATSPRVVGRVDAANATDTSTSLTDFATASNPRSACSTNGADLWITGGAGGVRYTTLGSTTSLQLATTLTNLRAGRIIGGQLYASAASGAFRLATVGTGTPTTNGQTITNLPGFPTATGSPYGFFFADLSASVAGLDTVYVADDGGSTGIQKYSLVSGSWVATGNLVAPGIRGLTGVVVGTTVTLCGTSASTLFKLTDTTGYNVTLAGTVSSLATAGANTAFRGLDWSPVSATPIELWRVAKFGAGATNTGTMADDADFDRDGVTNLLEYALGTDPTSANGADGSAALPTHLLGSSDPLLSDRLTITYRLPSPVPADLTYIIQASTDLQSWTPVATKIGTGAWTWQAGGTSHIVATPPVVSVGDAVDSASAPRRQLRLKMTNP